MTSPKAKHRPLPAWRPRSSRSMANLGNVVGWCGANQWPCALFRQPLLTKAARWQAARLDSFIFGCQALSFVVFGFRFFHFMHFIRFTRLDFISRGGVGN